MAVVAAAIIGASAYSGYRTYQAHNQDLESDLLLANIEAGIETDTSWSCDGSGGPCGADCKICGTSVHGTGKLTGSHKCSSN